MIRTIDRVIPTHPIRVKSRLSRLVLAFYGSVEHAEEALQEVRKNRFRRSGVVHCTEDGRLKFLHAGLLRYSRTAVPIATAFFVVLLGSVLRKDLLESVVAASGVFLIMFAALWLTPGLRRNILRNCGRFVLPGESVVIVQAAEDHTADAIAVLRRITLQSLFVIRPGLRFSSSSPSDEVVGESVTMASLPACAVELASAHVVDVSTKSQSLLPILRDCQDGIERARANLGEAAHLDYGIAHAAEWLLDNAYLIRSHIAEIRQNLPDNHNKILPLIANTSLSIRSRTYHIAADLIGRTGHRVARESIVSYLDAYQHQAPLTIAELWVFPLMLRFAIVLLPASLLLTAAVFAFYSHQLLTKIDAVVGQLRQFVSDASHELRTPLAVLQGETELLLARPRPTEEYQDAARVMESELKKLTRIVDGLFTLSMADAGQLRIATEPLYLEEVLEESCALALPLAQHKKIRIERNLKRDVLFNGDAAFLRQLFLIFLDNAIKYSPTGSSVHVSLATNDGVRVCFQDEGIGIAKEDLPHIFERFFRAGPATETHSGGLGLAIAQAIVAAHSGTIECTSESGVGSMFTVRLPEKNGV